MASNDPMHSDDQQPSFQMDRNLASTVFAEDDAFVRDFFRPLVSESAGSFGRFQIRDRLGQGTFGTVYRAVDTVLRREVAIKLPSDRYAWSDDELSRFYQEAMLAADLNHLAIIRVFDCGKFSEGKPYICMEFCPGHSLSHWLSDPESGIQDHRTSAKLVALMAEAVQHAHEKGIVHCDLKPQNTLLEPQNRMGIPPDIAVKLKNGWFIPRICDFGLARFVARESLTSSTGGTPAYMAPEQWRGQVAPSVDIFALGVILFQLLTNELPYPSVKRGDAIHERQKLPLLRMKHHRIPSDLTAICLACLKFDAEERYRSANELQKDLQRFLNDEPISVRRAGPIQAGVRFAKRHRIAAVLLVTVALGLAGTLWQWWLLRTETRNHITTLSARLADVEPEAILPVVRELRQYGQEHADVVEILERALPAEKGGLRGDIRRRIARMTITLTTRLANDAAPTVIESLSLGPRELVAIQELIREMQLSDSVRESMARSLREHLDANRAAARGAEWLATVAQLRALSSGQDGAEVSERAIADALVTQDLSLVNAWAGAFDPSPEMSSRLFEIATDQQQPLQSQYFATMMLIEYAALGSDVDLVELFLSVGPDKFSFFHASLTQPSDRQQLLDRLMREAGHAEPSTTDDDRAAKRRANALAAMAVLGDTDVLWKALREPKDFSAHGYLIDCMAPIRIPPELIVRRLAVEDNSDAIYALLLGLGGFDKSELHPDALSAALQYARSAYATSVVASVHSAVRSLMTRWNEPLPEVSRTRDEAIIRLNVRLKSITDATWYDNSIGQAMVALESRSHCLFNDRGQIPYSFAIAATETTKSEFAEFLNFQARNQSQSNDQSLFELFKQREAKNNTADAPNAPQGFVNWDEAARFCNWLSERESLDPCYEEHEENGQRRMVARADHLLRNGYRLPTSLEWQYACGVNRPTRRFFGNSESLFAKYAWCAVNVRDARLQPVAQLRPNPVGLFDMYGNVTEWSDDGVDADTRRIRGGAVGDWPVRMTTKRNDNNMASTDQPQYVSGFRVACTLISPAE